MNSRVQDAGIMEGEEKGRHDRAERKLFWYQLFHMYCRIRVEEILIPYVGAEMVKL